MNELYILASIETHMPMPIDWILLCVAFWDVVTVVRAILSFNQKVKHTRTQNPTPSRKWFVFFFRSHHNPRTRSAYKLNIPVFQFRYYVAVMCFNHFMLLMTFNFTSDSTLCLSSHVAIWNPFIFVQFLVLKLPLDGANPAWQIEML